LEHIWELLE
jgi:hypothetical protein